MTAKTKEPVPTTEAAALPLLSLTRGDVTIHQRELVEATALHNEIIRRKLWTLLPADMTLEMVHQHLSLHIEQVFRRSGLARESVEGTGAAQTIEDKAQEKLRRLIDLINGNYPPGSERRRAFFPVGPGPHTPAQQLRAAEAGIRQHGLAALPSDLTADSIGALAGALTAVDAQREQTDAGHEAAVTTVRNLLPETRTMRKRMAALVRGYYGRYSTELVAFGLKVQSAKRNSRPRTTPQGRQLAEQRRAAKKAAKQADAAAKKAAKRADKRALQAQQQAEIKALEAQIAALQAQAKAAEQAMQSGEKPAPPAVTGADGAGKADGAAAAGGDKSGGTQGAG
jgi:hypothetical protein